MMDKAIVAENVRDRRQAPCWAWESTPRANMNPKVYQFDLVTIGENSVIPAGREDRQEYSHCRRDHARRIIRTALLASGDYIIKAGGVI